MRLTRTSVMRLSFGCLFVIVLLSGCVLGQQPASTSSLPSSPAPPTASSPAPVSPPPIELKADSSGAVPAEQIRALLERAEEKDLENDKRARDYTYVERVERHELGGDGAAKKTETRTSEVLQIYGEDVERLIAKDDKPLPAGEAKKEDEKIQKLIDRRNGESEEARRKRLEKEEKNRAEDRKFVLEVADAFNFRLVGSEMINGRDTWVFDAEPRSGYEPKHREAKMLAKVHGRIWIDKAEDEWVKLDITAIDTISFGLVLARIHKGTHLILEMTRVNDEIWLPKRVQLHVDARVALFKSYDDDVEQTYRDYKKFHASTKITLAGEENRQ